ncbi:LysR family transcriptional regulator [Enterobacter cloacae complex sp. 374A1]|uniref:LysR family transcriptional regulator n=1 Tax=Enterobacter cloacae complex sp. 374A1 TaxID=3395832 RepID=UPI003CEA9F6C
MSGEIFRDLTAFITIARHRSFTRAAAELGVSQSALSHAIRNLEERIGLRLLIRTTRSVSPTEAGKRLLERVSPRLDTIARELTSVRDLSSTIAGTVRMTVSDFAYKTFVWPRLSETLRHYPDVRLELSLDAALTDIITERFDAGIRDGDSLGKNMASVRISPGLRYSAVASPGYVQDKGLPLIPGDLGQYSCISTRFTPGGSTTPWIVKENETGQILRPAGHLIFNSYYAAMDAALAGYGIAFLPEILSQPWLDSGKLVPILPGWWAERPGFYIYYPGERQMLPALSMIVETLRYEPPV